MVVFSLHHIHVCIDEPGAFGPGRRVSTLRYCCFYGELQFFSFAELSILLYLL